MEIRKFSNLEKLSDFCSELIANEINKKPSFVLGLATGSSPVKTYERLINKVKQNQVSFSKVKTVNLDEYVGLDESNENSYRFFMNDNLFNHIDIDKKNTFVPNGKAQDLEIECQAYEKNIAALGGIDLQVLGLGDNGHIGFNEPAQAFIPFTHVVDLTQKTIEANSRFFESADQVPKQAITMGIKSIMSAKKILLIVNKKEKNEILNLALTGNIHPEIPASILQLHPDLVVAMIED